MTTLTLRATLERVLHEVEEQAAPGRIVLLVTPSLGGARTVALRVARDLARRLPDLTPTQATEVAEVYAAANLRPREEPHRPPFRAPHYTCSTVGLLGGGRPDAAPSPGEVSLAHNGVLFLEDLPEFPQEDLEVFGSVVREGVAAYYRPRLGKVYHLPARPRAVVATSAPCPCGRCGLSLSQDAPPSGYCTPEMRARFRARLTGLQLPLTRPIFVPPVSAGEEV